MSYPRTQEEADALFEQDLLEEEYAARYAWRKERRQEGWTDEEIMQMEDQEAYEQEMIEDEAWAQAQDEAFNQAAYEQAYAHDQEQMQLQQQQQEEPQHARRSKNFHLTRILLKFVASMGEVGELSLDAKGVLKDLIVDQDETILAVAETFDADNDIDDFKDSLARLASAR